MAADMLDKVLKKEAEALKNETEAAEKAAQTVAAAKEQAKQLLAQAEAQCAEQEKEKVSEAEKQAEKMLATAAADAEKYADGLRKNAGLKFSEAVGLVKEIISR